MFPKTANAIRLLLCSQVNRFQQILYLVSDAVIPGGIGIQLDVYRTAGTTGVAASLNPVAAGTQVMEYITSYYTAIQSNLEAVKAAYVCYKPACECASLPLHLTLYAARLFHYDCGR